MIQWEVDLSVSRTMKRETVTHKDTEMQSSRCILHEMVVGTDRDIHQERGAETGRCTHTGMAAVIGFHKKIQILPKLLTLRWEELTQVDEHHDNEPQGEGI
jgi:hypothetical protein